MLFKVHLFFYYRIRKRNARGVDYYADYEEDIAMNEKEFFYVEPAEYFSKEMKEVLFEEYYKRIRLFVSRYPWTFAKTYADFAPHEYYVKDKLDDAGQEEFVWFVEFIRDYGFNCKFAGKEHTYFELDGYYYWTMGDPVEKTTILNRCKTKDYEIAEGNMYYLKA